jgi:hypothetical protein
LKAVGILRNTLSPRPLCPGEQPLKNTSSRVDRLEKFSSSGADDLVIYCLFFHKVGCRRSGSHVSPCRNPEEKDPGHPAGAVTGGRRSAAQE